VTGAAALLTLVLVLPWTRVPPPAAHHGTPALVRFRTTLSAEPEARDQLRIRSVRVWSRPSLSGIWCRPRLDAEVLVLEERRGALPVYEVISADGACRGWVDARLTSAGRPRER
jgi:hypothetical protein